MKYIMPGDRVFIELPELKKFSIAFSSTRPIIIRFVNLENKKLITNGGISEVKFQKISMDMIFTEPDMNASEFSPLTNLRSEYDCDKPVCIVLENAGNDTVEYLLDLEQVVYIPAHVERIPLKVHDFPF